MNNYPESWSALSHKELRRTLLAFLLELLDERYQGRRGLPPGKSFEIDDVVHFFFDDTDLVANPSSYIGEVLFDENEVASIEKVTLALDEIVDELQGKETEAYLASELWPRVVEQAGAAYAELQSGSKHFHSGLCNDD